MRLHERWLDVMFDHSTEVFYLSIPEVILLTVQNCGLVSVVETNLKPAFHLQTRFAHDHHSP